MSRFLYESGANIVTSAQYSTDPEGGAFFLRMEFGIASDKYDGLTERFGLAVAEPFEAEAHLLQLLDGCCDLVVLARYMEIFSGEFLDAGPIIEQDVIRVNHRDDVATLRRLGGDLERTVLARAVLWHCEDRVLRHGNTTIVF